MELTYFFDLCRLGTNFSMLRNVISLSGYSKLAIINLSQVFPDLGYDTIKISLFNILFKPKKSQGAQQYPYSFLKAKLILNRFKYLIILLN